MSFLIITVLNKTICKQGNDKHKSEFYKKLVLSQDKEHMFLISSKEASQKSNYFIAQEIQPLEEEHPPEVKHTRKNKRKDISKNASKSKVDIEDEVDQEIQVYTIDTKTQVKRTRKIPKTNKYVKQI